MMFTRILTAIVLIPLVVYGIFHLSPLHFLYCTTLLVAWSAWEWGVLIPCRQTVPRFAYMLLIVSLYYLAFRVPPLLLLTVSSIFWVVAILAIVTYPRITYAWFGGRIAQMLKGVFCIVPCWISINMLRELHSGSLVMMFFLLLVWGADTGAYFVGKFCGARKLAPAVSPGKTLEGVLGGLVVCAIVAALGGNYLHIGDLASKAFIFIAVAAGIFSVVGDLYISVQKRQLGLKDISHLLPGHGGFLDRVDSMMAAAPVFTFIILVLKIID